MWEILHVRFLIALMFTLGAATAMAQDATDKDYDIDFGGTTLELKVKAPGTIALKIVAKNGFKVSDETPLSVAFTAPAGLELGAKKLVRKDTLDPKSTSPGWKTTFTAQAAGSHEVNADLVFFLCTDKLCQRMTAKRSIKITAK